MKNLKLKALALGATEVLSRTQMKNVLGGTDPGGNDKCKDGKGGCTDGDCTISGGPCDGKAGTCGGPAPKCTCAGVCA